MTAPAVGDLAPDFTLKDQNNEEVTLSSFRGDKAVLIVFYPFAFTGTCTGELTRVRDELDTFQNDDVQVLTVSVDSPYTHKVFSEREGFEFPLLSDFWPHGQVAQAYGSFHDGGGMAMRGTFLVDKTGVVRFTELNGPGEGRDASAWQAAIKAL
jgi:peroxiredoxin